MSYNEIKKEEAPLEETPIKETPIEEIKKENTSKVTKKESSAEENKDERTSLEIENEKDVIKGINDIKKNSSDSLISKLLKLSKVNDETVKEKEVKFHKEYLQLQKKFEDKYEEVYKEVSEIVHSTSNITLDDDDYKTYKIPKEESNDNKPIDGFWLKTLVNSSFFEINEKDKKILEYLDDITIEATDNSPVNFHVTFIFKENPYLSNNTLIKYYQFSEIEDKILSVNCTKPEWKDEESDPTKKTVVKKIKKKKMIETITTIKNMKSFFNIFGDKNLKNLDLNEEEARTFQQDILPNSLEYYLEIFVKSDDVYNEESDYDEDNNKNNKKIKKKK